MPTLATQYELDYLYSCLSEEQKIQLKSFVVNPEKIKINGNIISSLNSNDALEIKIDFVAGIVN